jgi:hypothetical protein
MALLFAPKMATDALSVEKHLLSDASRNASQRKTRLIQIISVSFGQIGELEGDIPTTCQTHRKFKN